MKAIRNSVQLIGHLGKDPEMKTLESGKKLARFPLATNEYYKDNKGELTQKTEWHNIIAWGKLAENISNIMKKGNEMAIQGKLSHRTYKDNEGNTKYSTEIVAQEFIKLTRKEG